MIKQTSALLALMAVLWLAGGAAWASVAAGFKGAAQSIIYVEPVDAPRGP